MIQLSLAEGQQLQREGQETVAAKNEKLLGIMRRIAKSYSHAFGYVTTDDLRAFAVQNSLYPTHHNFWGSVLKGKGWTVIGRQPSKLPGNHHREIRVWKWEGV